jgi:hypothetical protein
MAKFCSAAVNVMTLLLATSRSHRLADALRADVGKHVEIGLVPFGRSA